MKLYSLKEKQDFAFLFSRGRRFYTPLFRVIVHSNTFTYPRFGFITPKTVDKRAVVRNRVRRRAREWVRKRIVAGLPPLDVVLVFQKESAASTRTLFYEELDLVFRRVFKDTWAR